MPNSQKVIENPVDTNVITGFLGAGKTTLIKSLLSQKPTGERWAVLVNEFGEVGIDGALLKSNKQQDVFIREVPGGCMCCTSGLPMQIALNQLLAEAKPDRLLIEPTGLGHPKEVLSTLVQPHYLDVLNLSSTLTLVDARKIADTRYTSHTIFNDQLVIADKIIATKPDLYTENDEAKLRAYLNKEPALAKTPLIIAENQFLPLDCLQGLSLYNPKSDHYHHHHHHDDTSTDLVSELALYGKVEVGNQGDGFFSHGWIIASDTTFSLNNVIATFEKVKVTRLKAVVITHQGIFEFNIADDELSVVEIDEAQDSRVEIITQDEQALRSLVETFNQTIFN